MALVQVFGKPDIFLTITSNPNWSEIKEELKPYEEPQNRLDLVARIFRAKLEELKYEIFKKQIFGPIAAYVYVIEFQKRGLPHAHFLIILKSNSKIIAPEAFDRFVSAEIPNISQYPYLHSTVIKHMMHGPCGDLNPSNICMKNNGKCKSHYPKKYYSQTYLANNSYPKYKRRNDNQTVKVRGHYLDNQWVVPYNPNLLAKFNCHINVEICSTVKAVKYLYKYIYKGHDRISFHINSNNSEKDIDEIQNCQSARWISPPEAIWRISSFILNENYPSVYTLQLHLENQQLITFKKTDKLDRIINNDFASRSMLTKYFNMNKTNEKAKSLLYNQFPEHFVWNQRDKFWMPRKKGHVIGRIVTTNPSEGERYYLRLLLNHIRGAACFKDLRMVNNVLTSSFRESALLRGLLKSDNNLTTCLEEACLYEMTYTLRRSFVTILAFCEPNDPKKLWEKFHILMSEDYAQLNISHFHVTNKALQHLASMLESMGKNINQYHLVNYDINLSEEETFMKEINEELAITVSQEDLSCISTLNTEQKYAYDLILNKLLNNEAGAFFIDGPGGTGKTYLYRVLLVTFRSKKLIALATASSGVAAAIMPGGRTAHSRFKLPLDIEEKATCSVSKQSGLAKLLQTTKLIIWDEAPMINKRAIEAVDIMLQDINESNLPFGGKIIIFGGDFRQVLPVLPRATKEEVINASLVMSYLWPSFIKIQLFENMRARFDQTFSDCLLRIGDGQEQIDDDNNITLPDNIIIPYEIDTTSLKKMITTVFSYIHNYPKNTHFMVNRAILTPKNDYVDEINNILINQFPGNLVTYYSFDETRDKNEQCFQKDFLNTLTPNGIPPHELVLKQNRPIILLRNLNPSEGLCNGTHLICKNFQPNMIDAEIASGYYLAKRVFLPRIPFIPLENNKYPFPFKRTQFPIRLCFAMTINKAQGQTLDYVGVYLPQPVFSHGQLYVALSRAKTFESIKFLIKPIIKAKLHDRYTKNVVYKKILTLAKLT
ncbi:hypothetical protein UlMin_010086 [Ulmus minor]